MFIAGSYGEFAVGYGGGTVLVAICWEVMLALTARTPACRAEFRHDEYLSSAPGYSSRHLIARSATGNISAHHPLLQRRGTGQHCSRTCICCNFIWIFVAP